MSSLKLYLILIKNNLVDKVSIYRELDAVHHAWNEVESTDITGVIHCAFIRPSIEGNIELPDIYKGKIIYTSSLKWALPEYYKSTSQPNAYIGLNEIRMPCYLALNQWGYEDIDEQVATKLLNRDEITLQSTDSTKETISLAAQKVLKHANNKPLNKEEIYARITESNYYHFNTPTPVHVLGVTLNRETVDTDYSKAAKVPVYGKTSEGCYYLLGEQSNEPQGWLKVLSNEKPDLYREISKYGVSNDEAYQSIYDQIPHDLQIILDQIRFHVLKGVMNQQDPLELLSIAPKWMLNQHIDYFGFSVRINNVLLASEITKVSELVQLTTHELLKLPNMGKRSIKDMCDAIVGKIISTEKELVEIGTISQIEGANEIAFNEEDLVPLINQIVKLPLKQHLDRTLEDLNDVDRLILHRRLGFQGKVQTLDDIGEKLGITRERVRQRQKKYIDKIIREEYWDDMIGMKIGQLLLDREEPLVLELLEVEDTWFEGFGDDSYVYFSNVIQMFSENAIQVIEAQGRHVITRITQKVWDVLIRDLKNSLKLKAEQKAWTRSEVEQYLESCLAEHSAKELMPLLKDAVYDFLQFEGDSMEAKLIVYGRSAESAVAAVLAQADKPLHYSEIAERASELLGRPVEERRAHGALSADGVWLYDRGTYGLIDHCPLPESKRKSIRQLVEHLLYMGPINKQWHSKEIIDQLRESFSGIPDELDPYTLRMSIEGSKTVNFLNRMVWARSDSGLTSGDRVEIAEAFIQILEDEGKPLSGKELKARLSELRGVDEGMQIYPNDRLVSVGPNTWGLAEWFR